MQQIGKDLTNEVSIFVSGGQSRISQVQAYFTADGRENSTAINDATFNQMVQDFLNATTMEEAERIGKEMDTYWAEQHWCLYWAALRSSAPLSPAGLAATPASGCLRTGMLTRSWPASGLPTNFA